MAINVLAIREISPEYAEKWIGESGVELHLAVHKHDQRSAFWINNTFEVWKDNGPFKAGDKVVIRYNYCEHLYGSNREDGSIADYMDLEDDTRVYFVPFDVVQLTIRGEDFIPPTGTCLCVRAKKETVSTTLYIPDTVAEEYEQDVFHVVKCGAPTEEHLIPYEPIAGVKNGRVYKDTLGRKLTEAIPNEGDMILSQKFMGLPIESPLNKKLDKEYWILPYSQVMALYQREGV